MKRSRVIPFFALCAAALFCYPLYGTANDDSCSESGIIVRNATMLDLWYKRDDGPCSIWRHGHRFSVRPQDTITLYSDMDCKTLYCPKPPTYKEYKSLDANGSCGVRILPNCNLSDM